MYFSKLMNYSQIPATSLKFVQIVNNCYSDYKKKPTLDCIEFENKSVTIKFEDKSVTRKISIDGVELDSGWKIEPLKETSVSDSVCKYTQIYIIINVYIELIFLSL